MVYALTYTWKLKQNKTLKQPNPYKMKSDLWLAEVGGEGRGNWKKVIKRYKFPVIIK